MLLGELMAERHRLHGGTQGLEEILALIGHAAGQANHLREENVNHIGNAHSKVMHIAVHHLAACGVPLRGGVKSRACSAYLSAVFQRVHLGNCTEGVAALAEVSDYIRQRLHGLASGPCVMQ